MTRKQPNAADPQQVKDAKTRAKNAQDLQDNDLRALLKLPEFRRYIWRHMTGTCGFPLNSPSNPNGSVQSTNIGMHDVARILWAELERVEPLAIPQIMTEHYEAQKREDG